MCMTVGRAGSLAISATFALAIFIASTASHAAETSEAFIVPLFPQKEADLKKGLPPGMTAYSFWAGRGTAKLRRLDNGGAQITFDFEGLIPYGLYTLWNVLETNPFKDEPLGESRLHGPRRYARPDRGQRGVGEGRRSSHSRCSGAVGLCTGARSDVHGIRAARSVAAREIRAADAATPRRASSGCASPERAASRR